MSISGLKCVSAGKPTLSRRFSTDGTLWLTGKWTTMEDLTLALVTLTSFVLLFVVAIFADRAGSDFDVPGEAQRVRVSASVDRPMASSSDATHADVA